MKTELNDGGPAFPCPTGDPAFEPDHGMSLRDYFASKETLGDLDGDDVFMSNEMAEALAGEPSPAHGWSTKNQDEILEMLRWEAKWRAALKFIRADAMLAARQKGAA